MKHGPQSVPTEPERLILGRIVRQYFGGLGGLSWDELGPERQEAYCAAGEAVARYVRATETNLTAEWLKERARHTEWLRADISALEGLVARTPGHDHFTRGSLETRLKAQQAELRELMGLPNQKRSQ